MRARQKGAHAVEFPKGKRCALQKQLSLTVDLNRGLGRQGHRHKSANRLSKKGLRQIAASCSMIHGNEDLIRISLIKDISIFL